MLSLFPEILFLAPFSALLLRISLAVLFAHSSWRHVAQGDMAVRAFAIVEAIVAAAFLAGAWTQAVALLGAALIAVGLVAPAFRLGARPTALLALVICASLLVTGAGAVAFDLPL